MKWAAATLICLVATSAAWAKAPATHSPTGGCAASAARYSLVVNGFTMVSGPAMSEGKNTLTLSGIHGFSTELWAWRQQVGTGGLQAARKNAVVMITDQSGKQRGRLTLSKAWPSKIAAGAATASTTGADQLIESVTLTFQNERTTCG
jgi:phage tail-like protein